MEIADLLLIFMGMLLFAVVLYPLAQRLHLPYSLMLVLGGFVGSELVTGFGVDLGLRWHHFQPLVFYFLLPALIFESALHLDGRALLRNLIPILLLSTPMLLLVAAVAALLLYWGIGYPDYFTLIAALLSGVLLSATDPAAVLDLFRRAGVPERLILLVDGESLFNDATAIVLFSLLTGMALMPSETISTVWVVERFLLIFVGGILVGIALSLVLGGLFCWLGAPFPRALITLVAAYGSYLVAEGLFHVSGVMAVLVAGLVFAELQRRFGAATAAPLNTLWTFIGELANALIFLLLGVTVTVGMFEQQWLAMLLGLAAALLSRAVGLLLFVPLINLLPGGRLDWRQQLVMYWGGVRGAVTIALALSLPLELDAWFTIQSVAYGVVLFALCIQVPSVPWLIKALGLASGRRE